MKLYKLAHLSALVACLAGTGPGVGPPNLPLLAARMFAIVDVWVALRSDRPYRLGWTADKVRDHIRAQSGTYFDPAVVAAFLEMYLRNQT
jgi:hypothetical protein